MVREHALSRGVKYRTAVPSAGPGAPLSAVLREVAELRAQLKLCEQESKDLRNQVKQLRRNKMDRRAGASLLFPEEVRE